MGSVSVSSCRCCMFVSCVHPVAVLNAAFCMTCSLLMLVEDATLTLLFSYSTLFCIYMYVFHNFLLYYILSIMFYIQSFHSDFRITL